MKTIMIIAPVTDGALDRTELENIEGSEYDTLDDVERFMEANFGNTQFDLYELSDFMGYWNNEEITEKDNWISYVFVKD